MGVPGTMRPYCKKPGMPCARRRWRGVGFLFAGIAGLLLGSPTNAASRLPCRPQAITCVEIMQSGSVTDTLPVTFGQVFKIGDVPRQAHLTAEDGQGKRLPLQMDESATYPDGSLRFAVLSTSLPHMAANETRLVSLLRGDTPGPPPPAPPARFDLRVELTTHVYQTTIIKFGNRNGHTPGIPFKLGETIAFHIGEEAFSLPVTPAMAGGDFASY